MAIILGLDSEVWTVIASIALVIATTMLATATWILGRSSGQHEMLTQAQTTAIQAQTASIETQTTALVRARIAVREVTRFSENRATIALRNNGLGPAGFRIRLSSESWSVELPVHEGTYYSLAGGDGRQYRFRIAGNIMQVDIKISYEDVLGTKYSVNIDHRRVLPSRTDQTPPPTSIAHEDRPSQGVPP